MSSAPADCGSGIRDDRRGEDPQRDHGGQHLHRGPGVLRILDRQRI